MRANSNPFARMSFETTVDFLRRSILEGGYDQLKVCREGFVGGGGKKAKRSGLISYSAFVSLLSIVQSCSSRLVVGRVPQSGTGLCDIMQPLVVERTDEDMPQGAKAYGDDTTYTNGLDEEENEF